jgi:hypothetical protein
MNVLLIAVDALRADAEAAPRRALQPRAIGRHPPERRTREARVRLDRRESFTRVHRHVAGSFHFRWQAGTV